MRLLIFLPILLLTNCAYDKNSILKTKNFFYENKNQKNLLDMSKKVSYTTEMTFNEFEIYLDEYVKKSKYPDMKQ